MPDRAPSSDLLTTSPRIACGSTNPAKRTAAERAAAAFFAHPQVEAIDVPSGVAAQPWGDTETAQGALQRARNARAALDADLGIGIESGVADGPGGHLYVIAWAAAVDSRGHHAFGSSERFPLPDEVAQHVRAGHELGPVIDAYLGLPGAARAQGAVSLLTGGRRTRPDILTLAALHALAALLQVWREQQPRRSS